MNGRILAIFIATLIFSQSTPAQTIDQALGADPSVDYSRLAKYGPWDDRNYLVPSPQHRHKPSVLPCEHCHRRRTRTPLTAANVAPSERTVQLL